MRKHLLFYYYYFSDFLQFVREKEKAFLLMIFLGLVSFQTAIALHESNGIDIIIALVLNDINPLGKQRMDLVLELKVCGSIL